MNASSTSLQQQLLTPHIILLASIAITIVAALLIYYPVLQFEYIWDDNFIHSHANAYTLENRFEEAFHKPFFDYYYRPLPVYSMFVEAYLGGRSNASYYGHAFNLLIFIANATLLILISTSILRRQFPNASPWLPLLAGLLLVCHPATATGPAWVSVRFDLSVTFFALLLLLNENTASLKIKRAIMTGLLFLLASLCKEMALSIALALPFWHLFLSGKVWKDWRDYWSWIRIKGHLHSYIAITFAGVIYLAIRTSVFGFTLLPHSANEIDLPTTSHLLYIGKTFQWYVRLIFWPFTDIAPAYFQKLPIDHHDILAIAGVVLIIVIFLSASLMHKLPRWKWACLGFIALLLPIMNIKFVPAIDSIVDMRFTYLPVALCIILIITGLGILAESQKKHWLKLLLPIAIGWAILGVANINITLPLWRNDLVFWHWYVSVAPQSAAGNKNYSFALLQYGQYQTAAHYAELAINSGIPNADGSRLVRGIAWVKLGQYTKGINDLQYFLKSPTTAELTAKAKSHMAEGMIALNQLPQAKLLLDEAITLYPDLLHAHLQLAHHASITNQSAESQQAMQNIVRILGNNPDIIKSALQESGMNEYQIKALIQDKYNGTQN